MVAENFYFLYKKFFIFFIIPQHNTHLLGQNQRKSVKDKDTQSLVDTYLMYVNTKNTKFSVIKKTNLSAKSK